MNFSAGSHEEWNIGIVHQPIADFLNQKITPQINWFPRLKKNGYLADPFAVTFNGKIKILCEEFDYDSSRGRIVCIELDENYCPSQLKPAMEFAFHTSYPYLFEHDGSIYCVPETARANEISLYEAADFPSKWVKVCTLVDGFAGSDPTLFTYEGRLWLTATGETEKDKWSRLFVWYASRLIGPWKPHEANPVKIDFRSARPAGTPFMHQGYLYRPAQDCSRTYGGRIVINRVTSLTEREFAEEEAGIVEADLNGPYPDGLHTICASGKLTLIDGKHE
jgi:hypothetical protein